MTDPEAAALAYANVVQSQDSQKYLIFDFGGSSFTASVVKVESGDA